MPDSEQHEAPQKGSRLNDFLQFLLLSAFIFTFCVGVVVSTFWHELIPDAFKDIGGPITGDMVSLADGFKALRAQVYALSASVLAVLLSCWAFAFWTEREKRKFQDVVEKLASAERGMDAVSRQMRSSLDNLEVSARSMESTVWEYESNTEYLDVIRRALKSKNRAPKEIPIRVVSSYSRVDQEHVFSGERQAALEEIADYMLRNFVSMHLLFSVGWFDLVEDGSEKLETIHQNVSSEIVGRVKKLKADVRPEQSEVVPENWTVN